MIAIKPRFFAILAVAIIALLAGAPSLAQVNSSRVGSDISIAVNGGSQLSVAPVISDTVQSDLLVYDFISGEIQFSAGVLSPDYDEPLFCFDMGVPESPVTLRVADPNGHVIIDDFDLKTSLEYVLTEPSTLLVNPTLDQQCFFRSDQGVFGLFGQASVNNVDPPGTIMRTRFETEFALSLEYQGVPQFVTLGETFSYDLEVTNTGDGDLNAVALQEVFPENLGVYAAALNSTNWSCTATGGAVCPGSSIDPSALRFQDFNAGGVDIPAGASLVFTIERTVDSDSVVGESIRLHAGAIGDPVVTGTPFAVAEELMTVVGASAGLSVSAAEAVADGSDSTSIVVTVLDSNGNPVPDETVTFDGVSPGGALNVSPSSGLSDPDGEVVFDSGSTTDAGDYIVDFSAGALTGSGTVTFNAGAPAAMNAVTTVNNVEANGSDQAQFTVTVLDQNGNLVSGEPVDVSDNGGLNGITPTTAFTDIDGDAVFTATSNDTGTFTVTFAVSGAGTDPADVTFEPGAFDSFAFVQQPTDALANEPIVPAVTVELLDSNGNRLTDDSTTEVELELRGPLLEYMGSAVVDEGLATFSNLVVDTVDVGYKLRATVPSLSSVFVDSQTFDVN